MTGGLVFVPHHPMIGTDYHGSIVKKVKEKIETKSNGRIKQSLEVHLRNGSIFTESRWLVRQDLIDREEAEQKRQAELSLKKVVSPVSAPAVTPLEKKKAGEKAHRSAAIDGESSIPTSDVKLKLVDVAGGSSSRRDTPHKDRQTSLAATPSEQESASLHGGGINATSISHKNSSTGTRRQSESKESQHEIQEIVPSPSSASNTTRETNIKSTNKKPKSFNIEQEFGRSKETISGSSGHRKIPPSEKNLMPQLSSPSVTVRKTKSSSAPSTPESKSSRPAKVPLGNNSGHKKIVETHQRLSALLRKPFSPKKPLSANGDLIQSTGSPKESSSLRSLSSETLTSKKVVKPRKTTIVESDHEIIPVARAQAEDNKLVLKHSSSPMTTLEISDGDGCTDLPPSRNISVEDKKPMARTNQVRKTGETTAIDSICELPTNDDSPSDTSSSLATVNQQICNEEIIGEAVTEVTRKVYGFTSGDSSKQKEPKSYADKEMVQETQPDVRSNTSLVVSSEKTPDLMSKDEDDSNDDKLEKVKKAKKNSKKSIDNSSIGSIMAHPETSVSTKKKKKKKAIEDVLPQKKGVKGNGKKKLRVDSALKDQETENNLGKRTTDILQANISDSDNDEGSHCRLEDVDRDSTTIATRIGPYDSPMASQTPPSMQSLVEGSHDEIAPPPPIATKSKAKLQHAIKSVDPHPGFAKIMGIWGARESKARDAIPFSPLKPESKVDDPVRGEDIEGSVRNGRVKLCNVFNRSLEADPKFQPPIFEKTEKDRDLIRQSFEVNFAFSDLTPSELEPMVDAFEKVEYQKGETIARQGEPDCFFYLVQNGEVSFNIDGERVSTGKTGDIFGELALVYSCDRASAVKAEEDQTALLRLHQTNYRHIRRDQVARSVSDRMKLLTKVPFFKEADEADLIQLSTAMVAHVFKAQDNLTATFKEAPFCLIQEGSVTSSSNGSDYGPGGSFGEENLSGKVSGVSNVVALTDGVAYTIDRLSFEKVFGDMNRIALKSLDKKVLREVRAVKAARISISQLDKLARQIAEKSFKAGENINVINEDMVPSLYLVRKGRIKTVRKNGKEEIISAGGHFGHEYLIVSSKGSRDSTPSHVKAKYTATAIEDSVCGVLTLQECVTVFGSESINTNLDKADYVALEDLTRHRILGEGHFGVVWLVTNRKSRNMDPYALKIQMLDNEEREALNCIKDEISMMRQLHSPFIVKLINTYEEEDSISMLLGLAPGGELFDQIHYQLPNGLWDSGIGEEKGRFYCSVVADTLSFMHIRGYIFRDLKPENVLIDKDGYPLLTDFGFTTHLKKNEKSYTMCGTPNYLPPEIIKNIGHGAPADNWSLGILIYEVVQGENPFYYEGLDQVSLFHAICNEDYYPLPEDKISGDLEDLIDRLLEKNPSKRLGTFREKDIITHPWFAEVDIRKMRRKELQAPWVPAPIRLN
jgi:CRP-like cAMP-binding protein